MMTLPGGSLTAACGCRTRGGPAEKLAASTCARTVFHNPRMRCHRRAGGTRRPTARRHGGQASGNIRQYWFNSPSQPSAAAGRRPPGPGRSRMMSAPADGCQAQDLDDGPTVDESAHMAQQLRIEFVDSIAKATTGLRSGVWAVLQVAQWWPAPPIELRNLRTNTPAAADVLDDDSVMTFKTMANLVTNLVWSRAYAATHEQIRIEDMLWYEGGPGHMMMVAEDALAYAQACLIMPPYVQVSMMVTLSRVAVLATKLLKKSQCSVLRGKLSATGIDDVSSINAMLDLLSVDINTAQVAERWAAQCLVHLHGWELDDPDDKDDSDSD